MSFTQTKFPYQNSFKKDAPFLSAGIVLGGVGWGLGKKSAPLSEAQINASQTANIWPAFDRAATRNWSLKTAKRSDYLLTTAALIPATLLLSPEIRKGHAGQTSLMAFETLFLTASLTQTVKNVALRKRPFVYNPSAPLALKLEKDARQSFFSGHTSLSAAACFFSAKVYSDLYPDSKWRPLVWTSAAAFPALVGWQRFKAGKHFPTDILVGYAIGGLCGWLVPQLH